MLPSRLAWSASSTIPPTSAFTPASSAESEKRDLPRTTEIGCSSGSWSSRRTMARASALVMPPTSTPAIVTPSAIRFSRELSYANAATAPPIRTNRTTATRMNHLCLMVRSPNEGTGGLGARRRLKAVLRLRDRRAAARKHGIDRAQDAGPIGVIALVCAEGAEIVGLERGQERDHLLRGEVVVVLDGPAGPGPLGLGTAALLLGALALGVAPGSRGGGALLRRAGALLGLLLSRTGALLHRPLRARGPVGRLASRLLRGYGAALRLGRAVGHVVGQVHPGRLSEARQEALQLHELGLAELGGRLVARVLHVGAPPEELLHLPLVAVRLLRAPDHRVDAEVLAELQHGLAAGVLVAEAARLEPAVVHPAPVAHLVQRLRGDLDS